MKKKKNDEEGITLDTATGNLRVVEGNIYESNFMSPKEFSFFKMSLDKVLSSLK